MATAVNSYVVGKARRATPLSLVEKVSHAQIDIADRNQAAVATAFQRMVEVAQGQLKLSEMELLLAQGSWSGLMQYLDLDARLAAIANGAGLPPAETSLREALTATWQQGARAELDRLDRVQVRKISIGMALSFDMTSPEAIQFLSTYLMGLIKDVSLETRLAIQGVVGEAFKTGGHPYEQARSIRGMIGLTQQQSKAVENFRAALSGDPASMRQALTRALRDKRFDPTVLRAARTGANLSQDQIDTMTTRYYERYLKYRSENIARTETIRASHIGQRETWRQAQAQGYLDPSDRQKWILTRDDKLCPRCQSVPKLNPEGVLLGEMFQSEDGPVEGPPLHPSCRCTTGLYFKEA